MKIFLIIVFSISFYNCSFVENHNYEVCQLQNNSFLRTLIREKRIEGQVILNDFDANANVDSFVGVYVKYPFKQTYTLDSIYYFYKSDGNYKILAQSEFEKGLIYLEVDRKGNHTRVFNFGGYVTAVKDVVSKNNKKDIELTFTVDVWSSTMPDTIALNAKILSNRENIDFGFFFRNESGLWVQTERD